MDSRDVAWSIRPDSISGVTAAMSADTRMAAEHGQIDPLLDRVGAGFARMVCAPDPATRESLAADTITARQKLVAHLAHEESGALALAQRVLSPARWDAVMAEFNEGLGLRELSFLVPWALHRLPAPAVDRLRAGKQRALLRLNVLFRRRFERYERAAFRQA